MAAALCSALGLLLGLLCGALGVDELALLEVSVEQRPGLSSSATLQGQLLHPGTGPPEELQGALVLVDPEQLRPDSSKALENLKSPENPERQESLEEADHADSSETDPWIGVVPLDLDQASMGNQESFAEAVVQKMKRALVLGASALIILALNQNTVSEMDLSQVVVKPIIVIQSSENVTRLFGALLRGLQATVRITYRTILQDHVGATLTLWSSCGRSRGGRYGEWQGVICTGETNSQVQKYLQQLWDTVLLVVLVLSGGVLLQAHLQSHNPPLEQQLQVLSKQDVVKKMSSLRTRTFQRLSYCEAVDSGPCAVCLEPFHNNQCLRVLPCAHEYHRDCVDPWLLLRPTCPLCKRSILGAALKES